MSGLKNQIKNILTYLPFLYYYLGPVAFATYLLTWRSLLGRVSLRGAIFGLLFLGYFTALLFMQGFSGGIYLIRFYWGFILFYLIFKSGVKVRLEPLVIFLSLMTIVEAILINTIIQAQLMPNFPSSEDAHQHFVPEGNFQRPYSFGGSASVTSVVLVALLSVSKLRSLWSLIVILAVVLCVSGSGYIALIVYFLSKIPRSYYVIILPSIVAVVFSAEIYKISADYILFLINFKIQQITDSYSSNMWLMGEVFDASDGGVGGDFAALTFLQYNGLIGLSLFMVIFVLNLNKSNWLPLLILITGTLHYGVIFFYPGQFALGYFMNKKN